MTFSETQGRRSAPSDAAAGPTRNIRPRTVAAATAEELRRQILDGVLAAGSALRQEALAAEFGISRIPLREALVQLEAEGLVRILPHRGAVVSELRIDEFDEVFELRLMLEPRLLRHSAPRLTPEDYTQLRLILSEYSDELRLNHVSRWGELNTAFHVRLYGRAERPRSLVLVTSLLQESDRLTRMQLAFTRQLNRAEEEHAGLLAFCEQGAFDKAAALLKLHIENVRKTLRSYLQESSRASGSRR